MKRLEGFDVTDSAELPDRGLLILERRFRYNEGVKMRIRRVAASEVKPGALIESQVLLEATDALNIDNIEAIGMCRHGGETVITIMSDDNFSGLQRTLIMQFALPSGEPITAGAPANCSTKCVTPRPAIARSSQFAPSTRRSRAPTTMPWSIPICRARAVSSAGVGKCMAV